MEYKITKTYTTDDLFVGIDFGVRNYLTLSNGKKYKCYPFYSQCPFEMTEDRKQRIAKDQRDWQIRLAYNLCRRYNFIFLEDLDFDKLEKDIPDYMRDCNHRQFVEILEGVAKRLGHVVHKINRYYPSTQLCTCGFRYRHLDLKDREWTCPACHQHHDRDINAANNILRRGLKEMGWA